MKYFRFKLLLGTVAMLALLVFSLWTKNELHSNLSIALSIICGLVTIQLVTNNRFERNFQRHFREKKPVAKPQNQWKPSYDQKVASLHETV